MENRWFYFAISPLSVLVLSYFFQALDFLLILPTFYYLRFHFGSIQFVPANIPYRYAFFAFTFYCIGQLLFALYAGAITDGFGRRKALLTIQAIRTASFFFGALGFSLISFILYFFGCFLAGVSASFSTVGLASVSDLYDEPLQRLRGYGFFTIPDGAIMGIFYFISSTLHYHTIEPTIPPVLLYLFSGIILIFLYLLIYYNFPETSSIDHSWKKGPWLKCFRGFGALFKEPQLKWLLALHFLNVFSMTTLVVNASTPLIPLIGENTLLFLFALFLGCWAIASGYLLPRVTRFLKNKWILIFCFAFMGMLNFIFFIIPSTFLSIVIVLTSGFVLGCLFTLIPWMTGEIFPFETRGRALSVVHFSYGLGLLLGMLINNNPIYLFLGLIVALLFQPKLEISGRLYRQ